jgi:hypothetical protein
MRIGILVLFCLMFLVIQVASFIYAILLLPFLYPKNLVLEWELLAGSFHGRNKIFYSMLFNRRNHLPYSTTPVLSATLFFSEIFNCTRTPHSPQAGGSMCSPLLAPFVVSGVSNLTPIPTIIFNMTPVGFLLHLVFRDCTALSF